MAEHYKRFLPGGSYARLNLSNWAVIDFRIGDEVVLKDREARDNLCHALFSKDFTTVTIKWGDSPTKTTYPLTGDKIARAASFNMSDGKGESSSKKATKRKRGEDEKETEKRVEGATRKKPAAKKKDNDTESEDDPPKEPAARKHVVKKAKKQDSEDGSNDESFTETVAKKPAASKGKGVTSNPAKCKCVGGNNNECCREDCMCQGCKCKTTGGCNKTKGR